MLAAIVTLSQPELFSLHGLIPVTRQDWLAVQYNWAKLKRFESKGCLPHQGESYRGESSINTEVSVDPEPVCIILKPRCKRLEKDPEILKRYGTIIVDNKGSRVGEGPQGSLLASLCSKFWVPKARQVVRKTLSWCVTCKRWEGRAFTQPATASLPKFRVSRAPPFSRVWGRFCLVNAWQRTR